MRRVLSLALAIVLLAGLFTCVPPAKAASKEDCNRVIGVVFDNSGSMYVGTTDSKKAWCRATYATEAFAAMMNPGDIMQVYPMNPITVDGVTYTYDDPLVIDQSNSAIIRDIYTPKPGDTHIETIKAACEGVLRTDADEKWLVVLTDGDVFYRNGVSLGKGEGTVSALEADLSECNSKMHVMYLGMGSQSAEPKEVSGDYIYHSEITSSSTEVLAALSDMCNTIFGRDTLPDAGKNIRFDVPMSKLILLVQGEGIHNVSLAGQTAIEVKEMRYATEGAGGSYASSALPDETLQGVMATYTDLTAGEYALSYGGTASSVVCYYEPAVDLVAALVDEAGDPVSSDGKALPGDYTLTYALIDNENNIVTSDLLGDTEYEIAVTLNGETQILEADEAGGVTLELKANDTMDAHVKVTYLGGYQDTADLGLPAEGLRILPPTAGTLEARISGGAEEYTIGDLPEQPAFRVDFIYDGNVLKGSQLEGLEQLQATVEGGNVGCRLGQDDDGVYVALDYYGTPQDTDCGDFTLRVSGVYRNKDDLLTNKATASVDFILEDNSRELDMKVDVPQDYYQISQLAQSEPIFAGLTYDGQPLTAEELDAVTFTCESESCKMILEPDYENSGYKIRFDPANPPESGTHKMKITASAINESGKETTEQKKVSVETGVIPNWLRIAIPIALLLLLLLIILLIMNQKVLPKGIYVKEMEFSVDGETIDIKRSPDFDGAGKSKGYIKVYSPRSGTDPMAEQAMFLTVSAVSPRRTPSRQRKAKVTMATVKSPQSVIYWKLKTHAYEPDPEKPGGFIHNVTGTPGFKEVEIGPTTDVEIQADTDSSSVIFRCKLGFK